MATAQDFEPRFRRHMTTAELGVRKGFRYKRATTPRLLDEVFATVTDREAIIPFLSGDEEHLLGFFV
jgi:hypothetical protein